MSFVSLSTAASRFIARDLYGLPREHWEHLTGTFTFGSGPSKAELDEIIRLSASATSRA
jgi:hypothetical protein